MKNEDFRTRTFRYGVRCVRLVETLPTTFLGSIVAKQLLRAATSVGANYRAAIRGKSPADFIAKMGIVEEECDETLFWIEFLLELRLVRAARVTSLYNEGNEILSICVASIKTARRNASRRAFSARRKKR